MSKSENLGYDLNRLLGGFHDKSILDDLYEESKIETITAEDFMKLPLNSDYKGDPKNIIYKQIERGPKIDEINEKEEINSKK
jgi:hypothetical protein